MLCSLLWSSLPGTTIILIGNRRQTLRYRERLGKRELGRLDMDSGLTVRACNVGDLVPGQPGGEPPALLGQEIPLLALEGGGWAGPDTHFEVLDRAGNHLALFRSEEQGKRGRYDVTTWVKALERSLLQPEAEEDEEVRSRFLQVAHLPSRHFNHSTCTRTEPHGSHCRRKTRRKMM